MDREYYTNLSFPKLADRPYVLCNMIATADGKATMAGVAHTIGDSHDHEMMQQLRVGVDAVLSGAGTLIKEDIIPSLSEKHQKERKKAGREPLPMGMTLTGNADLPLHKDFFTKKYRPHIFFTGDDPGELDKHATVIRVPVQTAVKTLLQFCKIDLGVDVLLLEGGPTLNHSFFEIGAVDEFFLTMAPRVSGKSGISVVEGETVLDSPLTLISQIQINSELFLRYKVENTAK
jgi:riboflavin biosynthesis pyrimidine reductase